jgi:IS1 family transposase
VYVITQVDRATRCFVGWDVAYDREQRRMQGLVDRAPQAARYYSDQLAVYDIIVYYPGKHESLPNKSQTYAVEADNAEPRHYLARLGRRSRCFTRSLEALRRALKLFIYAWNRRQIFRRAHPKYPAHLCDFVHPHL